MFLPQLPESSLSHEELLVQEEEVVGAPRAHPHPGMGTPARSPFLFLEVSSLPIYPMSPQG